jgi:hypothetical protein
MKGKTEICIQINFTAPDARRSGDRVENVDGSTFPLGALIFIAAALEMHFEKRSEARNAKIVRNV